MMDKILHDYVQHKSEPVRLLADLVDQIRPARGDHRDHAAHAIQALCHVLNREPALAQALHEAVLGLLGGRRPVSLYVDAGIQPSSGFFTEMFRRVGHKVLPEAVDPQYVKDVFGQIFRRRQDEVWVSAVPDEVWLQLLEAMRFEQADSRLLEACKRGLLDAVQVLSYRLSASGLEPELIRSHPELENHASPFIIQNVELGNFLEAPEDDRNDIRHILVMLDQCREVIGKIRRNSSQTGTSIHLTFLLQRMTQQIRRLESLLRIIANQRAGESASLEFVHLLKELVSAECHKNDVRKHWRENMELLALRVTENASRTGEHYITANRREYYSLMRSAMGAGIIIAFMAMLKIITAGKHYAPLTEAILFSLNYGLGFVIIHILHFTVATKQPAMTAAAIAASIDASDGKSREMDNLVNIIAQTIRSQTIAIIGNVSLAVPVAMLIGWSIYTLTGHHFIPPEKAHKLLADIHPWHSGALIYAGVAGVCLFLSGLIAGYHDNLAIYNKIPQRLKALAWLRMLLGPARLERVAKYVENNLGALAGNFYFGCLLGGMSGLGVLLGLPIDIRHIAFSSAFVGFSFSALDFNITWQLAVIAAVSVLLIGMVNLLVSFSLALYVAMKSRKVSFVQWRRFLITLLRRLNREPGKFFLPPPRGEAQTDASHGH
ncbi:MAG TPA: site-specific recombinase [Methylovorus sp.]|nr:site-specific recombinase [Methylovorus sp.]